MTFPRPTPEGYPCPTCGRHYPTATGAILCSFRDEEEEKRP